MSSKTKIARAIKDAMEDRGLVADPYTLPATINGKKASVVSIKANVLKIQAHDPITFLINVMEGKPMPCHEIDVNGKIETVYYTPGPKERVNVAKFLAHKIMPSMHLVKAVGDDEVPEKTGFDALVEEALNRARQRAKAIEHQGK